MTESESSTGVDETDGLDRFLTRAEDDELRRLNWISRIGALSVSKRERMLELRLRDRRQEIRPPRELAGDAVDAISARRRRSQQSSSR